MRTTLGALALLSAVTATAQAGTGEGPRCSPGALRACASLDVAAIRRDSGGPAVLIRDATGGPLVISTARPRLRDEQTASETLWDDTTVVSSSAAIECDAREPWCVAVVTPEPVTLLLLGSGLAGMGGLGFIRRRLGLGGSHA